MQIEYTIDGINEVASKCWHFFSHKKIWAFHAPMGAGKTTFIHTLCQSILKVKETVSSPTFAIINEYQSPIEGIIYHMDLYRLKDNEEALQAGVEDCILSGNLSFIEWPEKAEALIPDDALSIYINIIDVEKRRLKIED